MKQLTFILMTAILAGSGCCMFPSSHGYKGWEEYRKAEWEHRQKKVRPVIDALAEYKAVHGKYPQKLDELVELRMIHDVPDLTSNLDHKNESGNIEKASPLQYIRLSDDNYRLRFAFSFTEQAWTTSKDLGFEYSSGDNKWQGGFRKLPEAQEKEKLLPEKKLEDKPKE